MKINNRRYLGNKYKLLSFIKEIIDTENIKVNSIFDVFAGTGAVASAFVDKTVIVNDILYSNYLAHLTWFDPSPVDSKKIESIIKEYNNIDEINEDNYMSINFADTYFSKKVCKKIGYIREDIENKKNNKIINKREHAMLVTSLLYAIDKIANTCGHYDAYRKGVKYQDDFTMEMPELFDKLSKKNKCYNTDSNKLVSKVKCDLAYIDPPYNSRQYCDAYHLLENIAKWEKPEVKGVARKMDRSNLKSDYCTVKAKEAFEDLINKIDCKYILLSYNNTGESANDRSNAKLSDEDIIEILSKKGKVKIFSKKYKAFTTGKSENSKNEERVFLCIVNKKIISSPLNYTGGKAKLLPQIIPLFPEKITAFVDLFCGGGNVGVNVQSNSYYYNDVSNDVIGLIKMFENIESDKLISDIERIIEEYGLSNSKIKGYEYYKCNSSDGLGAYNKEKFIKLRNDFNNLNEKDIRYYEMFFTLIIYSFNNQIRFNNKGEFNLPVGKRDFNEKMEQKVLDFLERIKEQKPCFSCNSFEKFDISKLDDKSLVYCDPPYLITTASYNENGGWTEKEEKKLLDFLDKLESNNIKFALSNVIEHKGRKNEILKDWAERNNYKINYLDYNYSNSNYHAKNIDKNTSEVLITNYNIGGNM